MRILTCDPGVEIIGRAMLSMLENTEVQDYEEVLKQHHLTNIESDKWYPARLWLDVMNDLGKNPNFTGNLVAIGMAASTHAIMPPEAEQAGLPQILEMYDKIYQANHRGGDAGYVKTEKISDTHYKVLRRTLYPDDFGYGFTYGFARRFLPKGIQFTVKYDEQVKRIDQGGEVTIIHVIW